jgi:hypothetical protein
MKKMRKMRIFQKDAYIGIDFLDKKTEVIRLKNDQEADDMFTFDIETPTGTKQIAVENPVISKVNAIKAELTAFKDAIINNTPTVVSEQDGFMALQVAQQILTKIKQNGIIRSA